MQILMYANIQNGKDFIEYVSETHYPDCHLEHLSLLAGGDRFISDTFGEVINPFTVRYRKASELQSG